MNLNSKIKKCVYINNEGCVIKVIPFCEDIFSQLNAVSNLTEKGLFSNLLEYSEISQCEGIIKCKSALCVPLTNFFPRNTTHAEYSMNWINKIGNGIKELHDSNLCHYNLKPSNVLIDDEGNVLLGDYYKSEMPLSFESYTFLPMEYIVCKEYTKESDVWCYSCLIYYILIGEPPFTSKSIKELMLKKKRNLYHRLNASYPPIFNLILDACLSNNPNNRLTIESILYNLQNINSISIKPVKHRNENICKRCSYILNIECEYYMIKQTLDKILLYNYYKENSVNNLLPILDFLLDNYREKLELILQISYSNPLFKYLSLIEKDNTLRIRCNINDMLEIKKYYYIIKNLTKYNTLILILNFDISTLNFIRGLIELPNDRDNIIVNIKLYYSDYISDYIEPIMNCLTEKLANNKEVIFTLDTSKVSNLFDASNYLQVTLSFIKYFQLIHHIYFEGSENSYFISIISNNMNLLKHIHGISINGSCIEYFYNNNDPIVKLSSSLLIFNNLQELSFSFRCNEKFMSNLLQIIPDLESLRCLNMSDCKFTNKALDKLCKYESNLKNLDELRLEGNFVDKKHVNIFTKNISYLSKLKSLSLRRFNRFKSKGLFQLNMDKFNNLICLDVSRNGLNEYEQSILYNNFKYMPSLQKLDLSYNELKLKSSKLLSSTIILLSKMEYLDICKMEINDKMMQYLKPSLCQLKRLKYLDLRKNKISSRNVVNVKNIKVYLTELMKFLIQ